MCLTIKKPLAALAATAALFGSGILTAGAATAAPIETAAVKATTLVKPAVNRSALSAVVESVNPSDKTAVLAGKGTPGAVVMIRDIEGDVLAVAVVDDGGNWTADISGLHGGRNPINVYSPGGDGENDAKGIDLTIDVSTAGLVAGIDSTDGANKSAEISGKGEPGATITITYPDNQTITTTVDKDGNWHASTPNLTVGENTIHVTHTVNGTETATTDLTAIIGEQATPAVNPAIAASALGLGLGLGVASLRRITRKTR